MSSDPSSESGQLEAVASSQSALEAGSDETGLEEPLELADEGWIEVEVRFVELLLDELMAAPPEVAIAELPRGRWPQELFSRLPRNSQCRDRKHWRFSPVVFSSWANESEFAVMSRFVAAAYAKCQWVQMRQILVYFTVELLSWLRSEASDELPLFEKHVEAWVYDTNPYIRVASVKDVLARSLQSNALLTKVGRLLADPKSRWVRHTVAAGLARVVERGDDEGQLVASEFGSILLDMTQSDSSLRVRTAAIDVLKSLVQSGHYPLQLAEVMPLCAVDSPVASAAAQLAWKVILDCRRVSFANKLRRLLELVRGGKLSEKQAVLLLSHGANSWTDYAELLRSDEIEFSQLTLNLLVQWTEVCADGTLSSKGPEQRGTRLDLVLDVLNRCDADDRAIQGVYLFCYATLQDDYRELDLFCRKVDDFADLFVNRAGPALIAAIGDFWQYLYEDDNYQNWLKMRLELVAEIVKTSDDAYRANRIAGLCGSVAVPTSDLAELEFEALTRYICRQVEVEEHMGLDTIEYVQRLVELGRTRANPVGTLRTIGKFAARARELDWPVPRFSEESTAWLIGALWTMQGADLVDLAQCVLALWFHDVVGDDAVDAVRLVAAANPALASEMEDIELS